MTHAVSIGSGTQLPPDAALLLAGDHRDPHRYLGVHPASDATGRRGLVVRAMHPDAVGASCTSGGSTFEMRSVAQDSGIFEARIADTALPFHYRIRFSFSNGASWESDDAYRFSPTVGEVDQHLFNEGTHLKLWEIMGARVRELDGVRGVSFSVWAPNAKRVSVVGDFCDWDGRRYPMRMLGGSGIFELFVPSVSDGALYKYEIRAADGSIFLKSDPYARKMEQSPGNAAIVVADSAYEWGDQAWSEQRRVVDHAREAMLVYEVHLGSWARVPEEGNRPLTYREIAPRLLAHVRELGVTHVELMPIAEHPYTGSWGYQVTGFYAPTSRYGTPDDLRFLVDECHRNGVGVLLDWVPAHFPRDEFALRRFDGTALYEHADPRKGEHPDWGTNIFNLGRNEVRGFLVANALYWLREFHFDGLRVDAVASMLYLDYSREPGAWISNVQGGRENLEAVAFLRGVNEMVARECPGCMTIAEESTSWPGVTAPVAGGGLGFTFKWNLGWMHDSLSYFEHDPVHRSHHHDQITFAMLYEHTERFIMPLSHDEVVHEKRSLLAKMPGDQWQKFANLRALLTYMYTRPGKKLVFMGTELAQWREWNHDASLDWHLLEYPEHLSFLTFMRELGAVYRRNPALWRADHDAGGFTWIEANDRANSIFSYVRREAHEEIITILNLTPVARADYRIGAPRAGRYDLLLSSDDVRFGGGGGMQTGTEVWTEREGCHGMEQSLRLTLPPLSALVLRHAGAND